MSLTKAIGGGVAGAAAVTLLNESARRVIPHAPRMEVMGKRAIARPMLAMGFDPPHGRRLHQAALAGDLLSNSLYYSLVGAGRRHHAWQRGLVLGLLAGLGAVFLPHYLGLGKQPKQKTPVTQLLTILWYLTGGLAAAAAAEAMEE
jgi:hypothetical protein